MGYTPIPPKTLPNYTNILGLSHNLLEQVRFKISLIGGGDNDLATSWHLYSDDVTTSSLKSDCFDSELDSNLAFCHLRLGKRGQTKYSVDSKLQ